VLLAGAPADVGAPEGLEVRAAGAGVAGPVEGVGPAADGALVTAGRPAGAGRCGAGVGRPIAGPAGALAECDDAARAATDGLGATVRGRRLRARRDGGTDARGRVAADLAHRAVGRVRDAAPHRTRERPPGGDRQGGRGTRAGAGTREAARQRGRRCAARPRAKA
jgi:hypothetical protein